MPLKPDSLLLYGAKMPLFIFLCKFFLISYVGDVVRKKIAYLFHSNVHQKIKMMKKIYLSSVDHSENWQLVSIASTSRNRLLKFCCLFFQTQLPYRVTFDTFDMTFDFPTFAYFTCFPMLLWWLFFRFISIRVDLLPYLEVPSLGLILSIGEKKVS